MAILLKREVLLWKSKNEVRIGLLILLAAVALLGIGISYCSIKRVAQDQLLF
ncbi:hypothetical protein [Clostridium ganghwense]|uniref:ABC transporter permease n=1 Tax=Clostridium ganghwense TaxID=312089 RepID=A0ABT4CMG2_9CLOT|nr:hypothetical protein [Clostridium ganghwense]MCY6370250.1 hypothetical protein [Clostridium ganghwense]